MTSGNDATSLALRLRQQELVARFGGFGMAASDIQAVLDEACRVAAEGLETRLTKVLAHKPARDTYLVAAGTGWQPGVVGVLELGGGLESPAGYAFRVMGPVLSNRLVEETRFRVPEVLLEHGVESAINVLIQADGQPPFGVLEVDSTHRDEFSGHDVAFLQALGNILAVAIEAQRRQAALHDLVARNEALLAEKDLLIQEVDHRVMNSLNLVRSLLSLQAAGMTDAPARAALDAASARIMTIATVHRRLHLGGSATGGDASAYLRGLLDGMDELLGKATPIGLDMAPFHLPAAELASLGLIVTEQVANAGKHGGHPVRVAVRQGADGLEIAVDDAGPGFPSDHGPGTGLGMRLVRSLAGRVAGEAVRVDRSTPNGRIVVRTGFGGHGGAPGGALNPP